MNKSDLKYFLRNTKGISKVYDSLLNKIKGNSFKCDSIKYINWEFIKDKKTRINIFLPSFEADFVYGGVTTALKVMYEIANKANASIRIIVLNGFYSNKSTYKTHQISSSKESQDLIFIDEGRVLEIGVNDFFIGTFWTTIPSISNLLDAQKEYFDIEKRQLIYLIQDFEPAFYNWSTEYVLSERTYTQKPESIYAVFNTSLLQEYFHNHGYYFGNEVNFEPEINEALKQKLISSAAKKYREKIILIYGRPRVDRNVFEIIRYALSKWSDTYKNASEWKIYSLGASMSTLHLKNNIIESKGKLSLNDYADTMLKSYAAISLMVSPHPSYPPLEMSTFGIRTITNKFENKDLTGFNDNIVSIENCDPNIIYEKLCSLCDEYEKHVSEFSINKEYFDGGSFSSTTDLLAEYVKKGIINDDSQ